MTSGANLLDRLAEVVGTDNVVPAEGVEIAGVQPGLRVSPGTLEEVAAVLRIAAAEGSAVTPLGGGTQQRVGAPPKRIDILLATARLDALIEWEPGDLTACVQAGTTLAALQARLAEQGQQLPLDAPDADRATLGGLVATNTSGPRRWRYGSWRDLIVGMHMALTDGTAVKTGGRVVKNVQGYDLAKLFIGSLGTLGVIGQINVKLVPLPSTRRLMVARGPLAGVCSLVAELAASTRRASAIDLLDDAAASACGLSGSGDAGLVLLEGRPLVVDAGSIAVERLASAAGLRTACVEDDAIKAVWRTWVDLDRTSDLEPDEALITIHARPSEVMEAIEALHMAGGGDDMRRRIIARAGNGVVRCRLGSPTLASHLAQLKRRLLQRWPATTIAAGDYEIARSCLAWGAEPPGLEQMRSLKARLDPAGVLQPGRFVGGM